MGYLQPAVETYVAVYEGTLLSAPTMHGWKCDICQYIEFNEDALVRLDALIGGLDASAEFSRTGARPTPLESDAATKPDGKPAQRIKP